ncbi:MAG TPA: ABC transporter permease [Candidatus Hydrogenedentes bacterium]|nr:ABC transporter permease [Candidatus Hydrogenedentota bacterium]
MLENRLRPGGLTRVLEQEWVRPLGTLLFVVVFATVFSPHRDGHLVFWQSRNLFNVLRQISEIGILAVGMTLVIITGGIDLSVGSLLALASTLFAFTFLSHEWPLGAALAVALLATTLFGLVSGLLVSRLRMQPFIATLAVMTGSRGFAKWLVENKTIDFPMGQEYAARVADFLARQSVVIPTFACIALLGGLLLNRTRFGRYAVAIGGSEEAARLSGIPVRRVKMGVYVLSGFLAGIAGLLHCAQSHQGSSNAGMSYELDAIAAAVIGGTSLAGGKGGMLGTVVGALALGILSNLLGLRNVDENVQWMVKAVIIVIAVWLQMVGMKKKV